MNKLLELQTDVDELKAEFDTHLSALFIGKDGPVSFELAWFHKLFSHSDPRPDDWFADMKPIQHRRKAISYLQGWTHEWAQAHNWSIRIDAKLGWIYFEKVKKLKSPDPFQKTELRSPDPFQKTELKTQGELF